MTTDAQAIGLPFREAVSFFREKARVPTARWNDIWRGEHSHAFMVAGAATDALLADFQAAIQKALDKGTTLAEFRQDFDAIVEKHGWSHTGSRNWRSRIIYETNLATSYSAGRYAQLTEPETLAAFPYWQYKHSGSQHPRLQHLAWDGLTLRADDPFWATHYPPNGWRCGCRVRPVDGDDLRRMGKSGPDKAPPIEYRDWRDNNGVVHQVPIGIDPGWDYNPGMAKAEGKPTPIKAPDWTPASPEDKPITFKPIDVSDLAKADEKLKALQQPWADAMSDPERKALGRYKGAFGRELNEQARGEISDSALGHDVQALRQALKRAQAPTDMLLHRGVGKDEAALYRGQKRGTVLKAPAFVSTSISADVAGRVAKDEAGVLVELVVRKGQKGVAYVHPFPTYRFPQYEVLLNAGIGLKVLHADDQMIRLEVGDGDDTD